WQGADRGCCQGPGPSAPAGTAGAVARQVRSARAQLTERQASWRTIRVVAPQLEKTLAPPRHVRENPVALLPRVVRGPRLARVRVRMVECPGEQTLRGLLEGRLEGAEAKAVAAHIEECSHCQRLLDQLPAFSTATSEVESAPDAATIGAADCPP